MWPGRIKGWDSGYQGKNRQNRTVLMAKSEPCLFWAGSTMTLGGWRESRIPYL